MWNLGIVVALCHLKDGLKNNKVDWRHVRRSVMVVGLHWSDLEY